MLSIKVNLNILNTWKERITPLLSEKTVAITAIALSFIATFLSFKHGYITAYGDAESHLNIAKRVIDSLTPGFAQLGGIWLPLPHLLMIPFVKFNILWRTGLAGSIVSGAAFVVTSIFLFRLSYLLTKNKLASFVAAIIFMANPNVLYLQTTPMTELVLIAFFVISTFYFIQYMQDDKKFHSLILAGFFAFCAGLSRYDGWFLVGTEAFVLLLLYLPWKKFPTSFRKLKQYFDRPLWEKLQGRILLFSTLAFLGIILWFAWDLLILGDPLYFTHSQFSAKSQQNSWLIRGELPAYNNLPLSFLYYLVTSMSNIGVLMFVLAVAGFFVLIFDKQNKHRFYLGLVLMVPFIFNVATLYVGQSVIFIPDLTPVTFEWRLFNVRYGVMMVPVAALAISFLFYRLKLAGKALIGALFLSQIVFFVVGYSKVISMEDGVRGLSSAIAKLPDAQLFLAKEYDNGYVLVDDYARTLSIIRTDIPMKNVIYIGNKPYWEEALDTPQRQVKWIIMQKNDAVWNNFLNDPQKEGNLYKYYKKVYTSPDILVFVRNDVPQVANE